MYKIFIKKIKKIKILIFVRCPPQLTRMFNHWRRSLGRVEGLKQRLAEHAAQRDRERMRRVMGEWRQRLQSALVTRAFSHRLLLTQLTAWHAHAKGQSLGVG